MFLNRNIFISVLFFVFIINTLCIAENTQKNLDISIEIIANPVNDLYPIKCSSKIKLENGKQKFLFKLGTKKSTNSKKNISSYLNCGMEDKDLNSINFEDSSTLTDFINAEILLSAGYKPMFLTPEGIILINIMFNINKLSKIQDKNSIIYENINNKRNFSILNEGEVFIPILISNYKEKIDWGINEIFIKVSAKRKYYNRVDFANGKILVLTDIKEGKVLLDGGFIRELSGEQEIILNNVIPGIRKVSIVSTKNELKEKLVKVVKEKTSIVNLNNTPDNTLHDLLVYIGDNSRGFNEFRRKSDDAIVVKIPEGEFHMGNINTEGAPIEHKVYISDYYIDKTAVTWGQYKKFIEFTGKTLPPQVPYWGINDDHPVVFVTWEDSKSYCEWVGGRLPTEAEREKAARGTDQRKYPWGNREPSKNLAVFRSGWGFGSTEAVGSRPDGMSPYGLLDMAGNVWEWCSDWFDRDYFKYSPYFNPKGPKNGYSHVLKGGSWDSRPSVLSSSSRNFGQIGYRELDFGFRCAMNGN